MEIRRRRIPRGCVSLVLIPCADVLDATAIGKPDERDAPTLGEANLLTQLVGLGRNLAGNAARSQLLSNLPTLSAGLFVENGYQNR